MEYNKSCVTLRSMPFWCVGNPMSDPFGGAVLDRISSVEVARLIAWGAKEGYLEATGFHDDDLVPWDPDNPEDDLDPSSETSRTLREIKAILDAAGVSVNSAVCSLHGNKLFRNGGLCNPDPELRRLARLKVERTLRIGNFFNAKHYIYWVARDGFEVPLTVKWDEVYDWLADGLNHVWDYIHEQGFTNYVGATVEPKPNEPRGQMFLPTSGHAAGFILGKLRHPEFWGVTPELLQHESMALMNAVMTVGYLCSLNKLKFLHFGSQIKAQFDNDFPPLIGPEGLKETVQMFWALNQIGWKGVLEYDCHMLRAEADIGDQIGCRKVFIRNCAVATEIALALAGRIRQPEPQQSQSVVDLAATIQMCGLDGITGNRR